MKKSQEWVKNRKENQEKAVSTVFLRVSYYVLFVCFMATLGYVVLYAPYLNIANVTVSGTQEIDQNEVLKEIKGQFEGKYLGFIQKNNYFLISEKRIKNKLEEKFKKIGTLEIEKYFPNSLVVSIKEREAVIVWCTKGPCYIIDKNGYAYSGADLESDYIVSNNLIQIIDTGALEVNLGEAILTNEEVAFILKIKEAFSRLNIEINNQYQTPSRVSDTLEIMTQEGWRIYLDQQAPLEKSLHFLKLFLEKQTEVERPKLEYIDLRVENKIFYKLIKEEEKEEDREEDDGEDSENKNQEVERNNINEELSLNSNVTNTISTLPSLLQPDLNISSDEKEEIKDKKKKKKKKKDKDEDEKKDEDVETEDNVEEDSN